jgi:hypothetical protein
MDSVGTKLDLNAVGTRYDHYMELKEVFMTGIEVIDGMLPAHRSEGDIATRAKLASAVDAIDRRLLYLSNYSEKIQYWESLPKALREIEKTWKDEKGKRLLEAKNEAQDPSISGTPQDSKGSPQTGK